LTLLSKLNTRRIWATLGWILVGSIFYLSLTPKPPSSGIQFGDKIGHFIAYASLMFWWSRLASQRCRLALIFVLMGLTIEILQSLSGFRQGDIYDMAANTLGVGFGWLAAQLIFRHHGRFSA
jgi:VanZ family protein